MISYLGKYFVNIWIMPVGKPKKGQEQRFELRIGTSQRFQSMPFFFDLPLDKSTAFILAWMDKYRAELDGEVIAAKFWNDVKAQLMQTHGKDSVEADKLIEKAKEKGVITPGNDAIEVSDRMCGIFMETR